MAMTATLLFSLLVLQPISFFFAAPLGLTADLIRRDSPEPARLRSVGSPFSELTDKIGEYVMKIELGTPPLEITGVADTGSDLIWTQCSPCIKCFEQEAPKFNPISSSTYKDVPCDSRQCQNVRSVYCNGKNLGCPYEQFYADRYTFSVGTVGTDTITLNSTSGKPFILGETVIGCGHNNSLGDPEASGIIGLGWGPSSLVSQMGDAIQGIFSYCLGSKTSKINFGANAVISGEGTVSTPLFRKPSHPSFYYLNLEAMSVDGNRLETKGTSFHSTDGNIFIDSGTTYTKLPMEYYLRVKEAVVGSIKAERVKEGNVDDVCYKTDNFDDFPEITMHFNGADLVLGRSNAYRRFPPDVVCFTIYAADGYEPVFGIRSHENFLVSYDTQSEIISFKPTNCSALWG